MVGGVDAREDVLNAVRVSLAAVKLKEYLFAGKNDSSREDSSFILKETNEIGSTF